MYDELTFKMTLECTKFEYNVLQVDMFLTSALL